MRARCERSSSSRTIKIRRVVLCSGKVYYDLYEEREKRGLNDIYLMRVEQLYPFPHKALVHGAGALQERRNGLVPGRALQHGRLELRPAQYRTGAGQVSGRKCKRPRYAGRPASASTATGLMSRHMKELKKLLDEALG